MSHYRFDLIIIGYKVAVQYKKPTQQHLMHVQEGTKDFESGDAVLQNLQCITSLNNFKKCVFVRIVWNIPFTISMIRSFDTVGSAADPGR